MATGFEGALVKPVVDALIAIFKKAKTSKLKGNAEKALSEAIRELLLASPNLKSAEAKIAVVKAAGIINQDLILAEEMVEKHHTTMKGESIRKAATAKTLTKKAAKAKPPAKKAAATKTAGIRRAAF